MKQVQLDHKDLKRIFHMPTRWDRFWLLTWRTVKQLISLAVLFVVFFVLLNSGAYYQEVRYLFQNHPLSPVKVAPLPPTSASSPAPNYSPEIEIPKIGITAPIVMNIPLADVHAHLEQGVVQVQGSALPGQIGNMVVFGHSSDYPWVPGNFHNIFALLGNLVVGDQIAVPYQSQRFVYQVTNVKVVAPTDLAVVDKTSQPTLTLVTCYPVGTSSKRLVVTAMLVSGQITGAQASSPITTSIPAIR